LYCGKEIGTFRLLKDREFCRPDHRRKYGNRLGRAINQLSEPEPPPAAPADFVPQMPLQQGVTERSFAWFMPPARNSSHQLLDGWPEPADAMRLPGLALSIVPPGEEQKEPAIPSVPPASGPARAPQPEPVFRFVHTVAATEPAPCAIDVRFTAVLRPLPAISTPRASIQQTWMPVPTPEAVWSAVEASDALDTALAAHHTPRLPSVPAIADRCPPAEGTSRTRRCASAPGLLLGRLVICAAGRGVGADSSSCGNLAAAVLI
jgi:hypothetical protein